MAKVIAPFNFIILLASSVIILVVFILSNSKTSTSSDVVVAEGYNADLSGNIYPDEAYAYWDGANVPIPQLAIGQEKTQPVLGATSESKWIEVDLSDQKIYAWEGNQLYLESLVSTGLPGTPTPTGEFRIWIKLRAVKMEGGSGRGYYYLPNVPYTMFFENAEIPNWRGYGLHGTYWHHDFGRPKSHGCVNLPTEVAKQLYEWTTPVVPEGKGMVNADENNQGTRILIHE